MEFLKEILGEELYSQVEGKVNEYNTDDKNKDKKVKIVDLSSGQYVGKDKFDAKETEVAGLKQQLDDANTEIKSYKDMDIEGIKKAASDWETKYNTDTAELNKKLADQEYDHKLDKYVSALQINDEVHANNLKNEIKAKGLKFEEDKLTGGEDVVNSYKEKYAHVFPQQEQDDGEDDGNNPPPQFGASTPGPVNKGTKTEKDMTYEDYCKMYPMK